MDCWLRWQIINLFRESRCWQREATVCLVNRIFVNYQVEQIDESNNFFHKL